MRSDVRRGGVRLLLASSSVSALLLGGAPPAHAACSTSFTNTTAPGCSNTATINTITINNSTITSTITNTGTISPNGIVITNASTVVGGIADRTGTINGGISIDSNSTITGAGSGIAINRGTFTGGISNAGTIAIGAGSNIIVGANAQVGGNGANSFDIPTFAGGITNSGSLAGGRFGVLVGGIVHATSSSFIAATISSFADGITNTGTIKANEGGIAVGGVAVGGSAGHASVTVSLFSGSVSNSGSITAANGIEIGGSPQQGVPAGNVTISTFAGGVVNSGTIAASRFGIVVGGSPSFSGEVMISNVTGPISNSGSISAGSGGIVIGGNPTRGGVVTVLTVTSGVTNSGSIQGGNFGIAVGGNAPFSGQINISSFGGGIVNQANGSIAATGVGIAVGGLGVTLSTFAGGITNSGSIQGATGIRIDSGARSFAGAIANSGIISGTGGTAIDVHLALNAITINQIAGSIVGDIKLSAHADVLNVTGGAISGNIVGAGSSNTVNFAPGAGNTFTYASGFGFSGVNQVNINSGTVILNGTNSATGIDVVGGMLAGTGTLDPLAVTIHSGATFAPGNGAAGSSMAITGNLTFQSGATYQVQVNPTIASFATVSGTATLAGNVLAVFSPGQYVTRQYAILQSGGLSGTFAGLTRVNLPTGFQASLSYGGGDVFLDLALLPPAASGNSFNVNQGNVDSAISAFFNGGGALPPGFVNIFGLTGGNLANALNKLDGEAATDAQKGAFDLMTGFLGLMLDPFVDGRGLAGAGGASGFARDQPVGLPPDVALAYASVLKAPSKPLPFEQRWSAWGAAFGGYNTTRADPAVGSNDVTASAAGFAAGMDYRVMPDTTLGFALAGGGTGWSLAQNLGGGRSDAFQAGLYGATRRGPAYLAGALAFANHWMTTDRFAPGDHLQANFVAPSLGARLEGGYRFVLPAGHSAVGVTPYAAAQTQRFHTPSYVETDLTGSGFGLSYAAMAATDTRGELGARLDSLQWVTGVPLILRARAAWAHDWVSNPALTAVFQALPGASFIVNGAAAPKNSALASAGAELRVTPALSVGAKFDGEFANGAQTYAGTGVVRVSW